MVIHSNSPIPEQLGYLIRPPAFRFYQLNNPQNMNAKFTKYRTTFRSTDCWFLVCARISLTVLQQILQQFWQLSKETTICSIFFFHRQAPSVSAGDNLNNFIKSRQ